MHFGPMRLIAIFILATAIFILGGVTASALAVAKNFTHVSDCCPSEQPGEEEDAGCCVSPECQCLSCLTIELQQTSIDLAGICETACDHYEVTALLTGGHYSTIDYPPEIV
jgi:hypothetical protein